MHLHHSLVVCGRVTPRWSQTSGPEAELVGGLVQGLMLHNYTTPSATPESDLGGATVVNRNRLRRPAIKLQ